MDKLDFSALTKAINSLDTALVAHHKDATTEFIRDATIHRFEVTYELSGKMLRRYLSLTKAASETIDTLSYPDLIRLRVLSSSSIY